jgi:hypothetical protein
LRTEELAPVSHLKRGARQQPARAKRQRLEGAGAAMEAARVEGHKQIGERNGHEGWK